MTGHFHWMAAPVPHNIHCFSFGCPSYKRRTPLVTATPLTPQWHNAPILTMRDDFFWKLSALERLAVLAEALDVELEWEVAIVFRLTEREARLLFARYDLEDFGIRPLHELQRF